MGIGVLPSGSELEKAGIQVEVPGRATTGIDDQVHMEEGLQGAGSGSTQPDKKAEGKSQLFLAASGLPTVPQRLAQCIWDLDFIEMEEFLPSNKTVQALEIAGGARDGMVYQVSQA